MMLSPNDHNHDARNCNTDMSRRKIRIAHTDASREFDKVMPYRKPY